MKVKSDDQIKVLLSDQGGIRFCLPVGSVMDSRNGRSIDDGPSHIQKTRYSF